MNDDIDTWLAAKPLAAPPGFAARLTALAQATPQPRQPSRGFGAWQWASLGAGACFGASRLCEFVLVAFVAAGAH